MFHRKCFVNVPILEMSVISKLQIISNHRCFSFDKNYPNRRNYNFVALKNETKWCNFPYHKTFYESTINMDIETNELVIISVNLSIHFAHWWPALLLLFLASPTQWKISKFFVISSRWHWKYISIIKFLPQCVIRNVQWSEIFAMRCCCI